MNAPARHSASTIPAPVSIGTRRVGPGEPCYVIAEAGSNHDGRFEQAKRLVEVAAEAKADAVKFQLFKAERLYPPNAGKSDYLGDERNIYDIIESMEMPPEWLAPLAAHARSHGIAFLCSAFDEACVDLIAPHVDAFKCASYEMTHVPLLQHMARLGKPVLMSTGTATLDEVAQAVAAVRAAGNEQLVVLQCTAAYPAPLDALDLRALVTMRDALGVLTGLSDHSRDPIVGPMTAVALGAVVLEKHYTLSRRLPGPDHAFAIEPDELVDLVRRIREVERALGSGKKEVDPVERELLVFARRSIFTTRALPAGHRLAASDLAVLRAGKLAAGLPPVHLPVLLGRATTRALEPWAGVQWSDVGKGTVTLRPATTADAELVWRWNDDPEARKVSFDPARIPWATHERWYAARLADPATWLRIVEVDGRPAGVVRIQREASEDVLSVAVGPEHRGSGVGGEALRLACTTYAREVGRSAVVAKIRKDNDRSLRAFERAGFRRVRETEIAGHATVVSEWRG